jgi:hypothetical protein
MVRENSSLRISKIVFDLNYPKIQESIQQNPGAIIVWSDVDIQFFGLRPAHIRAYFDRTTDFVAQRWSVTSNEICGGFYAIRCSPTTYDFFIEVSNITRDKTAGNEQDAINLALRRSAVPINWRFFGPEYYSRSHGIRIPPNALLHHATCIVPRDYVNQKIALLTQLQNFYRWNPIRKRFYVLSQIPGALKRKIAAPHG